MENKEILEAIRKIIKEELTLLNKGLSKENEIMNIKETSLLTRLSVATIYVKCHQKNIPHYKNGKFLHFKRSEILNWMDKGKRFFRGDASSTS